MFATLPYIENAFRKYNGLCFRGVLPMPEIRLSRAETFLGRMEYRRHYGIFGTACDNYVLKISNRKDLSEVELDDVIIHEMIHYYLAWTGTRDRSAHGPKFRAMMKEINEKYGRNITISHKTTAPANIFNRSELLLGRDTMAALSKKKVILFGIGGVGSWCAESLIRTGLKHLTIVDSDCVSVTNINRQLMATTKTVGQPKVKALLERLMEINPEAKVKAIKGIFSEEFASAYRLESYDYVIDCIDSLKDKIDLLVLASSISGVKVYSSMGAALKVDPTRIQTAEFWKVRGCPLGAIMRKRMHQRDLKLGSKVMCVYSEEVLENKGMVKSEAVGYADSKRASTNGSLPHITAIFGFTLAGLIVKDIYEG